jgi:long-subunit fatty acid transport protein
MKKIMMTLVAIAMATTMNAQWYVGGGVGYNYAKDKNTDVTSNTFRIIPEVGYNLNEKWALGITVGYGESRVKVKNAGTEKVKTFQVSPYARYTFVKFDHVNLFIDGGVGYKHEDYAGMKTNTFGIGLKPGVAVNLNEKLSFVAHVGFLGYENEKVKGDDKSTNSFGFDLNGNALSFGVYYNF